MGTEIRTFYSLKEMNDYVTEQISDYKALSEDYSQWLGSLLRACEDTQKNEDWFQKSVALQKNVRAASKSVAETKASKSLAARGKKSESSCWVQSGEMMLCSTEEGEAEILFEAITEINRKTQSLEKFKISLQQLERIGLGKNFNYVTFIKDNVPEKIVLRGKSKSQIAENFSFAADFTVPNLPP